MGCGHLPVERGSACALAAGSHVPLRSPQHIWEMYTDIALLARASCLVASRSGFSNLAEWWGGARSCVRTLDDCISDMEAVYGAKMVGFESPLGRTSSV